MFSTFLFFALAFDGVPILSSLDVILAIFIIVYYVLTLIGKKQLDMRMLIFFPFLSFLFLAVRSDYGDFINIISISLIVIASFISISRLIKLGKENHIFFAFLLSLCINVCAVLVGFDSYWSYGGVQGSIEYETVMSRPSALLGNPNVFGLLAIGALIVFANIRFFKISIFIFLIILVTYVAVITASRKTALIIPVLLLSYFIFNKSNIQMTAKLFLYGFIPLCLIYGLYFVITYLDELLIIERIVNVRTDSSANFRAILIVEALEAINSNPLIGYGLGWFAKNSSYNLYAHVNMLELWLSGGIFLFLSFYIPHFFIIIKSLKDGNYMIFTSIILLFSLDFAMVSYDQNITSILLTFFVVKAFPCRSSRSFNMSKGIYYAPTKE